MYAGLGLYAMALAHNFTQCRLYDQNLALHNRTETIGSVSSVDALDDTRYAPTCGDIEAPDQRDDFFFENCEVSPYYLQWCTQFKTPP